jgi:hypothetical protein
MLFYHPSCLHAESESPGPLPGLDWPSRCIEEVEIYGLKKSAEELTSQAHAEAIRIQLLQRNAEGHGNTGRGYRGCKVIMFKAIMH